MADYKLALNQKVKLALSEEEGVVTARAEYAVGPNQYRVLYKSADGRQVTEWWEESHIVSAE